MLISCETGADGTVSVQAVANMLRVEVMTPTDIVYVYAHGTMKIGIAILSLGEYLHHKETSYEKSTLN